MPKIFVIEDQSHSEWLGKFATLDEAWAEMQRLSTIPWDESPNLAPCMSWQTCGRGYEIIEFETDSQPWRRVQSFAGLEMSATGVVWGPDSPQYGA